MALFEIITKTDYDVFLLAKHGQIDTYLDMNHGDLKWDKVVGVVELDSDNKIINTKPNNNNGIKQISIPNGRSTDCWTMPRENKIF